MSPAPQADTRRSELCHGNQAIREELATGWGQFPMAAEPGWPTSDSAQPENTRLIGGDVTFVTERADDIAGYRIHDC